VHADHQCYFERQRRAKAGHRDRASDQQARAGPGLAGVRRADVDDDGRGAGTVVGQSAVREFAVAGAVVGHAQIFRQCARVDRTRARVLRIGERGGRRGEQRRIR
jgi:hypothetical protein